MSMYGKVSAWLTVIGLAYLILPLPFMGILPKVGKKHNDASAAMSKAEADVSKAADDRRRQELDLVKISNELARAQLGWDKSWTLTNSANTGVQVQQDGRLMVAGIGQQNGLVPVSWTNDTGETEMSPPAVHVFKQMADGAIRYVGEFVADMQQNQIGPADVTLIPNWQVTPQEVQVWASNPQGAWRFRTLMPAAPRKKIDQLNLQIVRLTELFLETDGNFAQQERLLSQAESQLATRKAELLGAANAKPVPGRPELSDGLLKTIRSEEDQRNALQVDVDRLRRDIKRSAVERGQILNRLKELLRELPSGDGKNSQLTRGRDQTPN